MFKQPPGVLLQGTPRVRAGLFPALGHGALVDPGAPAQVGAAVLAYLAARFGSSGLSYAQAPSPVCSGWEAHTYCFQLTRRAGLPRQLALPLVARIFPSVHAAVRARREFACQQTLHALGYPVPRPVLLEESPQLFGGPFQVMEQVAGRTLVDLLLFRPWNVWRMAQEMAAIHARLHELRVSALPYQAEPFLERRLLELDGLIAEYDLAGLEPGLEWLVANRPPGPRSPSILHLDFHPVNVMVSPRGALNVIDWSEVDVGDYHADVATTLMLLRCAPLYDIPWWAQFFLPVGRLLLSFCYRREYARRRPLDPGRLAYYQALAAFRRLCNYGRWLCAGPAITGYKTSCLRYLTLSHLATLSDYLYLRTGVAVRVRAPTPRQNVFRPGLPRDFQRRH